MALDDLTIRNTKPREKPFKLFDEKGLFLLVNPAGSKLWRIKYPFAAEPLYGRSWHPLQTFREKGYSVEGARRRIAFTRPNRARAPNVRALVSALKQRFA